MCSTAIAGTDSSTKAIEMNSAGTELLKKQKFMEAQEKFAAGLAESPFAPELQFNLGIAFDGAGNVEKAKQAYELAAKNAKDPATRFAAYYNLGELSGRQKKVDEALAYYQMALLDKPDSLETKTNIELLVQNKKNQQDGKGGEQNKDNKGDKKDKDDKNKDKSDKNKDNKDKKDQDKKDDSKDKKDDNSDNKDKDKGKNGYDQSKPQPKPFKSDQLSPGDVKKILEELDRQEQRVRAEYNKKQMKEKPRDKDW